MKIRNVWIFPSVQVKLTKGGGGGGIFHNCKQDKNYQNESYLTQYHIKVF